MMRIGKVVRYVDFSGMSGVGVVAEVAEFSDGTVAMRWLETGSAQPGVRPTTVIHESIDSVMALHGHDGATQIEWAS